MKKMFYLSSVLFLTVVAQAQQSETIKVKAGDRVSDAISPNGVFRFPKFTDGVFVMKDGSKNSALFNFNIFNGEMLYLDSKGDTMAIGIPEQIEHITIGADNVQFIYNQKNYLEILAAASRGKLAKRIKIHIENDKKGGYGESAPSSSQDQLRNLTMNSGLYLLANDVTVLKTTTFYWVDNKNNAQPASKKNFMRMVAKEKQSEVEAFIEENKTNFNREDDLRKLLVFAGSL